MSRTKKSKKSRANGAGRFRQAVAASTVFRPKGRGGEDRKDAIERKRYKDKCPVRIEAEAVEQKAEALAKVIQDRDVVLEEKRAANAKYRERLAYFDERLKELAESVRSHSEIRDVEVIDFLLERTGEVVTIRQDTGEQIGEARAATAEDRQDTLALDDDTKKEEGPGDEEDDDDELTSEELEQRAGEAEGDARAGDGG